MLLIDEDFKNFIQILLVDLHLIFNVFKVSFAQILLAFTILQVILLNLQDVRMVSIYESYHTTLSWF